MSRKSEREKKKSQLQTNQELQGVCGSVSRVPQHNKLSCKRCSLFSMRHGGWLPRLWGVSFTGWHQWRVTGLKLHHKTQKTYSTQNLPPLFLYIVWTSQAVLTKHLFWVTICFSHDLGEKPGLSAGNCEKEPIAMYLRWCRTAKKSNLARLVCFKQFSKLEILISWVHRMHR